MMAEGVIESLIVGEEEAPELEGVETPVSTDAFASAIAAKLANTDSEVARETAAYLRYQSKLIETQTQHLQAEHALRLEHLRNILLEGKTRRLGLRLRVAIQCFFAFLAVVILIAFGVMVREAVSSRSVLVDEIDVPPSLEERQLTGRIVASRLVDELTKIQLATRSANEKRDIADAWSNEINVEVPETGISIGKINSILRTKLGHDQHISGDLVAFGERGLSLTIRGSEITPTTFSDADGDLEKLSHKAAEFVYANAQPGLWATYLVDLDRWQEAVAFCEAIIDRAPKMDVPVLYMNWAIAIGATGGDYHEALGLAQKAVELKPDLWDAYDTIATIQYQLADEEAVLAVGKSVEKVAGGRPGKAPEITYALPDTTVWDLRAIRNGMRADLVTPSASNTWEFAAGPTLAAVEVWMHDLPEAERTLKTTRPSWDDPTFEAGVALVRGLMKAELGDYQAAATYMDSFVKAYASPAVRWLYTPDICFAAPIFEAAGQPSKADEIFATGGAYVDCYRFRADILEGRGDHSGADAWYEKAIQLAPDLPAGYYSRGLTLAKRGDLAEAVKQLELANARGPHWAEPLKAWGDVLVKQGKTKEALVRYEEALKYAPKWKELSGARDEAAKLTI
jgi:tetratricopeptide (TPR) repeat protein